MCSSENLGIDYNQQLSLRLHIHVLWKCTNCGTLQQHVKWKCKTFLANIESVVFFTSYHFMFTCLSSLFWFLQNKRLIRVIVQLLSLLSCFSDIAPMQIPHLRPAEYKRSRLPRNRRTVNRAYGGVLSGSAVRERQNYVHYLIAVKWFLMLLLFFVRCD